MSRNLLSRQEVIGVILGVVLAMIMGGWSVIIIAVTIGTLIGFTSESLRADMRRALIVGLIASVAVALGAFIRNEIISQLPGQEEIPDSARSLLAYGGAIVLGTLAAWIVASIRAQPDDKTRRTGTLIFLAVCAIIFPFFNTLTGLDIVWSATIIVALIYAMQALGLNIVAGYAGMLDLGYVAFFAIGGYTAAFLMSPQLLGPDKANHVSFWIVLFIAAAIAAVFGLILGAPVIPLRGDYLAIVTLGFGEIVPIVFRNLESVTIVEPISRIVTAIQGIPEQVICLVGCNGVPLNLTNGTRGLNPIDRPVLPFSIGPEGFSLMPYTFETGRYIPWYFLILILVVLAAFFINHLRRSRLGRAWVGMREDELAASAMGVPLVRTKLAAFTIGAMFSGFAGAFYASYVSFISPDAFDFSISVIVLAMVILGGAGNIPGVLLGALLIKIVDPLLLDKLQVIIGGILNVTILEWVQVPGLDNFLNSLLNPTQYKLMLFGLVLVVMMRVRPQGLIPAGIERYKG
jgi:branched-chain amino acid transport system permease protein